MGVNQDVNKDGPEPKDGGGHRQHPTGELGEASLPRRSRLADEDRHSLRGTTRMTHKSLAAGESIAIRLERRSLPIEIILSPGKSGVRIYEVQLAETGNYVLKSKTGSDDLIALAEGCEINLSRGHRSPMPICISREHAKVVARDGFLIVSDIRSKFGTDVVYQRIEAQ
jgi:hypothetical protein